MISLIAAMDLNHGIGLNGKLPWHLPRDLAHFKARTMGKPLILGRTTFEGMGCRALPGRHMIVLTSQRDYRLPEGHPAMIAHNVPQALALARDMALTLELGPDVECMVAGGAKVYEQLLPYCERFYVTLVAGVFPCDTFLDLRAWAVNTLSHSYAPPDDKNPHGCLFLELSR